MLRWLKNFWIGSPPVEFESAFDLAQSVERLRAVTKRSVFSAMSQEAAVGKVTQTRVSLQRVIPMMANSFKPIFVGRFESSGGKVLLRGSFVLRGFTKLSTAVWFGVLVLMVLSVGTDFGETWWTLTAVIGMAVAGLAILIGRWLSRKDPVWLSNVIATALSAPVEAAPPPMPGVPLHLLIFAGLIALEGVLDLVRAVTGLDILGLPESNRLLGILSGLLMFAWAYGIRELYRPAWWAGFGVLAYWGYASSSMTIESLPSDPDLPDLAGTAQTVSSVVGLLMVGLLALWWYAQRIHFQTGLARK